MIDAIDDTMDEAQKRVLAGAAWLDEHAPNLAPGEHWQARISLSRLAMAWYSRCVVGQVWQISEDADDRPDEIKHWSAWLEHVKLTPAQAVNLGLDAEVISGVSYEDLHEAWVSYLSAWASDQPDATVRDSEGQR